MPSYVYLGTFTEQGLRAIKETTKRAKAFRDLAKGMGVTIKDIYWTLGPYDVVLTLEAPNDETIAALSMKVGSLGNLKTQTLRAFTESEIDASLAKLS